MQIALELVLGPVLLVEAFKWRLGSDVVVGTFVTRGPNGVFYSRFHVGTFWICALDNWAMVLGL